MVTQEQRENFYNRCINGTARKQRERIMKYLLMINNPVTRHQIAQVFKPIFEGDLAFDGQPKIPLQSVCSAIYSLMGRDKKNPDFVKVSHKGKDPVTQSDNVDFLIPIGDKWDQRRMFDDFG